MKHKKTISFFIIGCIILFFLLLLGGMGYYQKNAFRLFCHEIFLEDLQGDTLGLHYTLAHPQKLGINPHDVTLPTYQKEKALEQYKNIKEYCSRLEAFDPSDLSLEEQYTQSLLHSFLSDELEVRRYFYLKEMFSPSGGIQIQYPILMAEYSFRSKKDIEDYLELLKLTPSYFESYCDFTDEKVKKGFGMPDFSINKVLSQCETVITEEEIADDSHFLVTTFHDRIQRALEDSVISEEEAKRYCSLNKEYLSSFFLNAYTTLSQSMRSYLGKGTNNDGLFYFKDGRNYYSWLFRKTTGSDKALPDIYQALAKNYYNSLLELRNMLMDFETCCYLTGEDFSYFPLQDSEEMLNHLSSRMKNDFPSITKSFQIPSFQATIKDVSPSLEAFAAPAYYLVPPLDDASLNSIYINRACAPSGLDLYTTLAHEGYPGHLYQTTYYQLYRETKNLPYLRNTLHYGGYVEGWALYAELLSYDYAADLLVEDTKKEDYRLLCDIYKQERCVSLAMLSLLDIGIHYYGLTLDRVEELLEAHGIQDKDTMRKIYEYIIEEPTTYPKYYWGYMEILSLKEDAKQMMGKDYSDYSFHRFLLESGPSDFGTLYSRLHNTEEE